MNEIVQSNRIFALGLRKTLVDSQDSEPTLCLGPGDTGALFHIMSDKADPKHPLLETLNRRAATGTGVLLALDQTKKIELIEILDQYIN